MITVFEAFAGYGAQSLALKRSKIDFKTIGRSEIDKYANIAYTALHGDVPNFGDIRDIDWHKVPDFDLFTYSFPCTDISTAGKQQGFVKGSETSSSLLWECLNAIKTKKPRYLVMENVRALLSKKFAPTFRMWCNELSNLGYKNYYETLNSLDFNVPQDRKRVFMVSKLDSNIYLFPKKIPLTLSLANVLQTSVDTKYYLSQKACDYIKSRLGKYAQINGEYASTITAKGGNNWTETFICDSAIIKLPRGKNNGGIKSYCPTITSCAFEQNNFIISYTPKDTSNTVTCSTGKGGNTDQFVMQAGNLRKLTPREVFRLMNVDDNDIDTLLSSGISNSQLYKMAGNSIVVSVLAAIFANLLK